VPQYSNTGYALIGYILKHKTGEDIQSLASRYIFHPLQMANSSFTPQQLKGYPQRALGHAGDQPKFIPRANHPGLAFFQQHGGGSELIQ
jgi:CubicO group peptidase (beta-lactamase class C family)